MLYEVITEDRAEVHDRLGVVVRPLLRCKLLGPAPEALLGSAGARVTVQGEQPAEDAPHVAVEDRGRGVEGDRENRPGGRAADPRITSYNVCYTKLLRGLDPVAHGQCGHERRRNNFV